MQVVDPSKRIKSRLITEKEASQIDGMSVSWHQRARWAGNGPPYIKLGSAVRYDEDELRIWFAARTRLSTSDTG